MLMPARAHGTLRASTIETTGAVQRVTRATQTCGNHASETSHNHAARVRNNRIVDLERLGKRVSRRPTIVSCRHFDITIVRMIEDLSYDVGRPHIDGRKRTHRRDESVDIPAAVPEHVRPAFSSTATKR